MSKKYLCIDVGGSSIKYALTDESLELTDYGKITTPYEGVETYLDCLAGIYHKFEDQVSGIGMAVPGIVTPEGLLKTAGNLHFAEGLSLAEELKKRCDVPVGVMNDAKCAALAEAKWGALAGVKTGAVIVLGTGIGGAVIMNGEVHLGCHYAAGEFSFIANDGAPDSPDTVWYGQNGNPRLLQMASRIKNIPADQITGQDIFRWIEEGDENMSRMMDRFTNTIAKHIFNLQLILDPERFAIGGGISRQPLLLEYIKKNLDYRYMEFGDAIPRAEVTTCRFFNEANLLGAYGHLLDVMECK